MSSFVLCVPFVVQIGTGVLSLKCKSSGRSRPSSLPIPAAHSANKQANRNRSLKFEVASFKSLRTRSSCQTKPIGRRGQSCETKPIAPQRHGGQVLCGKRVMMNGTHTGPRQNKANCRTGHRARVGDLAGRRRSRLYKQSQLGERVTLALRERPCETKPIADTMRRDRGDGAASRGRHPSPSPACGHWPSASQLYKRNPIRDGPAGPTTTLDGIGGVEILRCF